MLMRMRKGAGSWIAKIFLGIVALSFVVWGIGDVFRGDSATTAADAGSVQISFNQLAQAYSNETRSLAQNGVAVEPGSELAAVLVDVVLNQLIDQALFDQEAAGMGVSIGEQTVADAIATNPAFQNQAGQFDRNVFPMVLANIGMSEGQYIATLRRQLASAQLIDSFRASPPLPDTMVNALFNHRNERRTAEIVVVSNNVLAIGSEPAAGELERYYESNADTYRAPEFRSADFVIVYPEDLADDIIVEEQLLLEEYDSTINRWVTPERRTVQQIAFDTEDEARAAHDKLNTSTDFMAVAEEAGQSPDTIEMGSFVKDELFAEIADPIFNLNEGSFSEPVAAPLGGWQIFRVTSIEAGATRSFDDAREELERMVAVDLARNSLFDLINDLDDLLIAGDSLREAAATLGLEVRSIREIDASGNASDPMSFEVIPSEPEFLQELYIAELNEPSPVMETMSGALLSLEITDVSTTRMREFDEVKDRVLDDWRKNRQAIDAALAADEIASSLDAETPLSDAAAFGEPLTVGNETFSRSGSPQTPGADLSIVSALFDADTGDIVVRPSLDGSAQVIARLVSIEAADPANDPEGMDAMTASVSGGGRQAIADQHLAYLRQNYTININRELISQRF